MHCKHATHIKKNTYRCALGLYGGEPHISVCSQCGGQGNMLGEKGHVKHVKRVKEPCDDVQKRHEFVRQGILYSGNEALIEQLKVVESLLERSTHWTKCQRSARLRAIYNMWEPQAKKAHAVITRHVGNSRFFKTLSLEAMAYNVFIMPWNVNISNQKLAQAKNLITWGYKRSHHEYIGDGRNVLFIENPLLKQQLGFYVNSSGFFAHSNITCWDRPTTTQALKDLQDHVKRAFGTSLYSYRKPNSGKYLVVLQTQNDAPVKYYFPGLKGNSINDFLGILKDTGIKNLVVRPHPRHSLTQTQRNLILGNWELEESNKPIYQIWQDYDGIITINSTVATEALAFGMPVATFGQSCYTGHDVTLDCSTCYHRVHDLNNYQPERERVTKYLVAVRRSTADKEATSIMDKEEIITWLKNCR